MAEKMRIAQEFRDNNHDFRKTKTFVRNVIGNQGNRVSSLRPSTLVHWANKLTAGIAPGDDQRRLNYGDNHHLAIPFGSAREEEILTAFLDNGWSLSRLAAHFGESKSTLWRVIRVRHGYKSFKPKQTHRLKPADLPMRARCCAEIRDFLAAQYDAAQRDGKTFNFWMSDESTFHVSGKINRQLHQVWAHENPHFTVEFDKNSPKVNVWAAVSRKDIYGPIFIDDNITEELYLQYLADFMDELDTRGELNDDSSVCIFQQDGAPAHYGNFTRWFLSHVFGDRWIGRGAPVVEWPPRSPDLTVCDFWLWGHVKNRVYGQPIADMADLKQKIKDAFRSISHAMLNNVFDGFDTRLDQCELLAGGKVEVCRKKHCFVCR